MDARRSGSCVQDRSQQVREGAEARGDRNAQFPQQSPIRVDERSPVVPALSRCRVAAPRSSYARVYLTGDRAIHRALRGLYTIAANVDENSSRPIRPPAAADPEAGQCEPFHDLGGNWGALRADYEPKKDSHHGGRAARDRVLPVRQPRAGRGVRGPDSASTWTSRPSPVCGGAVGQQHRQPARTRPELLRAPVAGDAQAHHLVPGIRITRLGGFVSVQSGSYATGSIYKPGPTHPFLTACSPSRRSATVSRRMRESETIFNPARSQCRSPKIVAVIRPVVAEERGRARAVEAVAGGRTGLLPFTAARGEVRGGAARQA